MVVYMELLRDPKPYALKSPEEYSQTVQSSTVGVHRFTSLGCGRLGAGLSFTIKVSLLSL